MIATALLVVAGFVIVSAASSSGTTLVGLPARFALPMCAATAVGRLLFAFRNWRFPACDAYLGKAMIPSSWSHCGTPLRLGPRTG